MRILVIGKTGFIATSLARILSREGHNVVVCGRPELDFLDDHSVDRFLARGEKWDGMIFTPVKGGRRTKLDELFDIEDNLHMHRNMLKFGAYCRLIFIFGSGAAFGRQRSVHRVSSSELGSVVPTDPYGLSKMLIELDARNYESIINLRLFNCFGPGEADNRMITSCLKRAKDCLVPVIHEDREFDFFWIEDLGSIVLYYLNALDGGTISELPTEINCVYKEKYKLSEIADLIWKSVTGQEFKSGDSGECGSSYSGMCEIPEGIKCGGLCLGFTNHLKLISDISK